MFARTFPVSDAAPKWTRTVNDAGFGLLWSAAEREIDSWYSAVSSAERSGHRCGSQRCDQPSEWIFPEYSSREGQAKCERFLANELDMDSDGSIDGGSRAFGFGIGCAGRGPVGSGFATTGFSKDDDMLPGEEFKRFLEDEASGLDFAADLVEGHLVLGLDGNIGIFAAELDQDQPAAAA